MSVKEGAMVLMADNTLRPIQNCKRGHRVMSVVSGHLAPSWVNFVTTYSEPEVITITAGNAVVTVEPTALVGSGTSATQYKIAAQLALGDEIKVVEDGLVHLEKIDSISHEENLFLIHEVNIEGGGNIVAGGVVVR